MTNTEHETRYSDQQIAVTRAYLWGDGKQRAVWIIDQLLTDNAALREELEQVKAEKNENACRYLNAISERNQLQRDQDFIVDLFKAGIEVLDKALRFYADKKGYQPTGWQGDQSPLVVIKDEGNTARQVLEKYDLLEPK